MRNIILAGLFLLFTVSNTQAWEIDPRVEVGGQALIYSDDSDAESNWGGKIVLGDKRFPVYFWGSIDNPEGNILAQEIASLEVMGAGLGFDYKIDKEISIFIEAGYGQVSSSIDKPILDEMVYTYIVNGWTPEELEASNIACAYNSPTNDKECYKGAADIKGAPMARIGIAYQAWEHVKVTAGYRYMRSDVDLTMTDDGNRSNNTGASYTETAEFNLDAFEIGVMFTW
jgi:opacity protein-like surface antigen